MNMSETQNAPVAGTLEVGTNGHGEVVINHPALRPDENGVGHIVFSPRQARNLAQLLHRKAREAEKETGAHGSQ